MKIPLKNPLPLLRRLPLSRWVFRFSGKVIAFIVLVSFLWLAWFAYQHAYRVAFLKQNIDESVLTSHTQQLNLSLFDKVVAEMVKKQTPRPVPTVRNPL